MDDRILILTLVEDGVWARSEFPHPLITIDFDADDNPIQIEIVGPMAEAAKVSRGLEA
jgi:hypothetical protein